MDVKVKSGKYIKFFIYLIIIVLINLVGITLFFRIDLTKNKIYSLSKASKQVVSTLSEPLTINVFFTKNLPAPHNNTEQYLHDMLEEYSAYGNQYFNYKFYNVSAEEGDITNKSRENQELAKNYGIYPVQIRIIKGDEVKFQKAYMGIVLIHGDMIERIPTITSIGRLEYKITMAIQKLNNKVSAFLGLKGKIHIKLFLSSSLNVVAPLMRLKNLPEIPQRLENIVENINDKFYGKLKYEYLDPAKDPNLEEIAGKKDIMDLKWPSLSSGKIKPGKGYIGLVIEYMEKTITIPLIHVFRLPLMGTHYELVKMDTMEELINNSLESIIDINEEVGYLADHGSLKISGVSQRRQMRQQGQNILSSFPSLVSQNYTIKEINLKDGLIPEGINCMIIAGPQEAFTDYELFQIDQFLMKGKNLALFLDTFKESMSPNQGPTYPPVNTGLEKLLDHYGININKSYVMDENCYKQKLPQQFGGGERPIYFAPVIKTKFINGDILFMKNIKGLIAMKISPLDLDMERLTKNGLNAKKLFSSSERSWEMSDRINLNPVFINPPKMDNELQSLPLSYMVEGMFTSYFSGKPVPEKKLADSGAEKEDKKETENKKPDVELSKIISKDEFISKGRPAKVFLIASSEMLKDYLLDEAGESPNAAFIMNVLDYLNDREDIAIMRSKEQRFNPLYDTGAGAKNFIKYFNIAGLPVLVVIFGLLIWLYRNSRKKHIQMIFQK